MFRRDKTGDALGLPVSEVEGEEGLREVVFVRGKLQLFCVMRTGLFRLAANRPETKRKRKIINVGL